MVIWRLNRPFVGFVMSFNMRFNSWVGQSRIEKSYFCGMNQLSSLEIYEYLKSFLTAERIQKIERFAEESSDFILPVLQDVYQFRNAAAVIRSVEACGFHKVVALEDQNLFKPNTKVTRGAETWVEIEKMPFSTLSLQKIKARGYKILSVTKAPDAVSITNYELTAPVALIFGNEMRGVAKEVVDFSDQSVYIPMYGFTESFNVSVAAAICMYEMKKKLINSPLNYKLSEEKKLDLKVRWATHSARSGDELLRNFIKQHPVSTSHMG